MKNHLFRIFPAAACVLTFFVAGFIACAESDVSMDTYTLSDGTNCFLVPLQAESVESTADYVDVAILIDTSASQMTSEVRQRGQQAVESLINNLPANARVQIFTVNNETESITNGFIAVDDPALADAVELLKKSIPLGAADLEKSFDVASQAFDYSESADRSIAFIGRGVSTSALFDTQTFEKVVGNLVENHIAVNTFGNGVVNNYTVLGSLANQTGGIIVDTTVTDGMKAGQQLAEAATATVLWPEEKEITLAEDVSVYPNPIPPIRSDRETYLFGSSTAPLADTQLNIPAVLGDGREVSVDWNIKADVSRSQNQYLYPMVQAAAQDNGMGLPLAGRDMLNEYQVSVLNTVDTASDLAQLALEDGNIEDARRLAELVESQLPGDKIAEDILAQTDEEVDIQIDEPADVQEDDLEEAQTSDPVVADTGNAADSDTQDAFAKAEQIVKNQNNASVGTQGANLMTATSNNVALLTQQIKTDVKVKIDDARKLVRTDPAGAVQEIKMMINAVRQNPGLSAADRNALLSDLEVTGQYIAREKADMEKKYYLAQRNKATAEARMNAMSQRLKNQQRVVEIMERFDSLIKEGDYILAAEAAEAAAAVTDDIALPTQAARVALIQDAYAENQYLRFYRRKRLLDVLMSVERSHVPVSDEPPITYPDPNVWIALSKERKSKGYEKGQGLTDSEEAKKISRALDMKVDVNGEKIPV
ncbi:MAG: hypothetical protein IKW74_02325 [Thermoguttaceae bacterium]|nr:hypothetical protein [Thermoguttaceae bacterium]